MTTQSYDAKQTAGCDALRARLQSIAILAVQAQDMDPSGDPLMDLLSTIGDDLRTAAALNAALNRDDVNRAHEIATTGRVR